MTKPIVKQRYKNNQPKKKPHYNKATQIKKSNSQPIKSRQMKPNK